MNIDSYLDAVRGRLAGAGFEVEVPSSSGPALAARRRQVRLTRFGLVETVVGVSRSRAETTPDELRAFGEDVHQSALAGKSRIPLGLGASLVVYPVMVIEHVSQELRGFLADYAPKHWCVVEFPVVVEVTTGSLIHLEKTPIWGSAYYRRTREEARELFDPAA